MGEVMLNNAHNGGMIGGYGLHGFYSLLMMILIVVAIILAIRWMWRAGHPDQSSASSALQMLAERYAKGEIDEAEYLDRKKNLI